MIIAFLDKNFKPIANNASLAIDKKNFNLIKRPIELNDFNCVCEAFTADFQPTFLLVKDDIGREVFYSCLAGVPEITKDNKTQITGTDLKALLSSDVILNYGTYTMTNTTGDVLNYIFKQWATQVNQNTINYGVIYKDDADKVNLSSYIPAGEQQVYSAYEEIKLVLQAYDLYIDTEIDLSLKKVNFIIGKTMSAETIQIKVWEYNLKNFGKWIADVNETQAYYNNNGSWTQSQLKWILTSDNKITNDTTKRDIYPIKRKVYVSTESLIEAEKEAVASILQSRYQDNIEIPTIDFKPSFSSVFKVFIKKNNKPVEYKTLPCGELRYDYHGLYEVQIGYRYTGVDFI